MKKLLLAFIFFTQSLVGFSQFLDDFSDGDFTNNPTWIGDVSNFEVDATYKLHLNDSVTNTSYLSVASQAIINGSWKFDVWFDFPPSTSNYAKVYLTSDEQELSSALNGYFIKIGGESGVIDDVSLYVQNGISTTKIIDGTDGIAATNPNLKIKVIRDNLGNWELFIDTSGGYFSEGTILDTSIITSSYFGVFCEYTSTRAEKIWFDNFNVSGEFLIDTVAPIVTNIAVNSSNSVLISFSKDMDPSSAQNINNYIINNGIGPPNSITILNPKSIELIFVNTFVSPNSYQLSISAIEDLEQNILLPFDTTFSYFLVAENDVIINEIFADPTPSVGLPEYEYLELYNTTNSVINLTNWTIMIGTTDKVFPSSVIEPDSFVVLVKEGALDSFPSNISKIGFSSISLTNSGANVILKNAEGKTINAISYTNKWYNDDNKNEGGWSIERINPNLYCEKQNNWRASVAHNGGTAGKKNSVLGESVYIEDFRITKAFIIDSNKLQVHFNKSMDSLQLVDCSFFSVNNTFPIKSSPITPFFNSLDLTFGFNFLENTTYTISA
ncbi:MAG: lamin tail domain-containing protein, partial [Flavobacteriales bacterium]